MKWLIRGFIVSHVWLYQVTSGRIGGNLGPNAILLLHTVGRKSGRPQVTPLVYFRDGDNYVITASNGGADRHPAWYHNLKAQPRTHIQVLGQRLQVRAEEVTTAERERLWPRLIASHPQFAGYQTKTTRVIPLLALRPQ